jgi:hypothetical protein
MRPVEIGPGARCIHALALIGFYGLATLIGGILFLVINRAVALLGVDILFYRGVVALAVVCVLLVPLCGRILRRAPAVLGLSARDGLGAALAATSVLLAGFVLGPVTVDRSVSVFMLSRFDRADAPLTSQAVRDVFVKTYVDDWRQIDRRLLEQQASGNLEKTATGWRLTAQGRNFMKVSRIMSRAFDGDPRFVGREK